MATSITATASQAVSAHEEDVRYEGIKQYSVAQILGVWAAAALPMAALSWIVAPVLRDHLSGPGNVPMIKAMLLLLTAGMVWQFVLVALLLIAGSQFTLFAMWFDMESNKDLGGRGRRRNSRLCGHRRAPARRQRDGDREDRDQPPHRSQAAVHLSSSSMVFPPLTN